MKTVENGMKAMEKLMEATGWPVHYKEDYTEHDVSILRRLRPMKWLWILREGGTWLCPLDCPEWGYGNYDSNLHEWRYYYETRENVLYMEWDGHKLSMIKPKEAIKLIEEQLESPEVVSGAFKALHDYLGKRGRYIREDGEGGYIIEGKYGELCHGSMKEVYDWVRSHF